MAYPIIFHSQIHENLIDLLGEVVGGPSGRGSPLFIQPLRHDSRYFIQLLLDGFQQPGEAVRFLSQRLQRSVACLFDVDVGLTRVPVGTERGLIHLIQQLKVVMEFLLAEGDALDDLPSEIADHFDEEGVGIVTILHVAFHASVIDFEELHLLVKVEQRPLEDAGDVLTDGPHGHLGLFQRRLGEGYDPALQLGTRRGTRCGHPLNQLPAQVGVPVRFGRDEARVIQPEEEVEVADALVVIHPVPFEDRLAFVRNSSPQVHAL